MSQLSVLIKKNVLAIGYVISKKEILCVHVCVCVGGIGGRRATDIFFRSRHCDDTLSTC